MRKVQWEQMFPHELELALKACPVVYLPYGICEPHGPQNALGLDGLKAHGVALRAARRYGGIVAPPDYWHVHECGGYAVWAEQRIGEARPWLTAVPPWIHFKNICYHIRAVDALGFHAAILLTGHYGPNWEDLKTLVQILQPHFVMQIYGLPDFEANQPGFDEGGEGGDHADKIETSLLWALAPNCVDMSRLPRREKTGPHFGMGATAHKSNRRAGRRMVENEVRWLGKKARELISEYKKKHVRRREPLSFRDIEQIWNDEIRGRIKDFASMAELFEGQKRGPSAHSRWRLNWRIPKTF